MYITTLHDTSNYDLVSESAFRNGSLEVFSSSNITQNTTLEEPSQFLEWASHCLGSWLPPNHILFQIANIFLFLSYLAPVGIYGLLYLRSCLVLGSLFFALWGWLVLCALDTFIWNAVFTLINLVHVGVLLYMLRPVRFSPELEEVYRDLFRPLRVTRHQFRTAVRYMREVRHLKPREPYCVENVTKVDRLSLVIAGRYAFFACSTLLISSS